MTCPPEAAVPPAIPAPRMNGAEENFSGPSRPPILTCLDVRSLNSAGACTVLVSGEVDHATAPGLLENLLAVLDCRPLPREIVVDLSRVTFLGAAGLTVLVIA